MIHLNMCDQCYQRLTEDQAEMWEDVCKEYFLEGSFTKLFLSTALKDLEKKGYIVTTENCSRYEAYYVKPLGMKMYENGATFCAFRKRHGNEV